MCGRSTHHERRSTGSNCSNVRHAGLASYYVVERLHVHVLVHVEISLPLHSTPSSSLDLCLLLDYKPGDPRPAAPLKQTQLKIKQQTIAQTRKMALLQLRVVSKMPYRMGDQPANNSTSCLLCCPAATSID